MTQRERAKQFMPFDAMKGLKEALREREERHLREEKRELSEEAAERLSAQINRVTKGALVKVQYYKAFHEMTLQGKVTNIDFVYRYLVIGEERIYFDDLYKLTIKE